MVVEFVSQYPTGIAHLKSGQGQLTIYHVITEPMTLGPVLGRKGSKSPAEVASDRSSFLISGTLG